MVTNPAYTSPTSYNKQFRLGYLHLTDCDGRKLNVPTAWLKIWKTIGGEKKKRKVLRRINSSQNGLYLRLK